ncbi:hypothetical protein [Nitrososphaera viennensis]|uniref:Uncharacterized protein n=2 Tax=Nitrososphaera viennensis TaxID=1034015 RepID=A0A060HGS9_9ARCH|nr:hypothetical protein [Nitrososphaera viennensis]AIC14783.1 hypothetical protein NVIE_005810 [Nitrososphaera viennensis EN76]UVS69738.1 hypothetical protein NWT39_02875 [Nitrososphaera viennensis]
MSKEDHISRMKALGFDGVSIESFEKMWDPLAGDGYDMYAMYTGADGSALEDKAGCVICSKKSFPLRWEKVITPSQDSAAIYTVCTDCDAAYVEAAIRQKALGRLLKERNTRPN